MHSGLSDVPVVVVQSGSDCSDGEASTDGKPVFAQRQFEPLRANETAWHEAESRCAPDKG